MGIQNIFFLIMQIVVKVSSISKLASRMRQIYQPSYSWHLATVTPASKRGSDFIKFVMYKSSTLSSHRRVDPKNNRKREDWSTYAQLLFPNSSVRPRYSTSCSYSTQSKVGLPGLPYYIARQHLPRAQLLFSAGSSLQSSILLGCQTLQVSFPLFPGQTFNLFQLYSFISIFFVSFGSQSKILL